MDGVVGTVKSVIFRKVKSGYIVIDSPRFIDYAFIGEVRDTRMFKIIWLL